MMSSSRRRAEREHERARRDACRPGTDVNLPWAAFPPLPANAPVFPSVVQQPRRAAVTGTVPTSVAATVKAC
ncbi:hypothetical protein K466DRAFT_590694 [Polyporus arcularius HHB13444]|uniref:Uncharacterized protein n=1 Tax=Polyporus arcularius HHB13444 TaxID=1314778 RepID=A0A5C3P0S5_9APHY|nr:hypothetical protein K466DRAFT_590694 [Polyporus arcularius HHB13444]